MPDIFLSYSREDAATARRFAEGFEHAGLEVWWDATLRSGEAYDQVTEKALNDAKAVVVLWSKTSVSSRWVRAEATEADRNSTLVPVMIEPCKRPIMFELTHTADLSHWKGDARDPAWVAFLDDVRRFVHGDARPVPGPDGRAAPAVSHPSRARALTLAAVVVLVMAAAMGTWFAVRPKSPHGENLPASLPAPPVSAVVDTSRARPSATSVAVVPFVNLTGEPAKEYFSDGMAEELINVLGKVPGLEVASRTSSFAYKGRSTDVRQIARDLGVRNVLEGSVRSAGERVRISAQLVDAETGFNLWSDSYDRKYGDLFKLQDDLAREIVTAFRKTMGTDAPEFQSQAPPTQDLEAYGLYLQSLAAVARSSDAGAEDGIRLARAAVDRDPQFARAWWALSAAMSLRGSGPLAAMEEPARRALELDPTLVQAEANIAQVEARRGNWIAAEEIFRKLRPAVRDPNIANFYAISTLWPMGHLERAKAEFQDAYRIGPGFAGAIGNLGRLYSNLGMDAEADRFTRIAVNAGFDPSGRRARQVYIDAAVRQGRYAEAADMMVASLPPHLQVGENAEAVRRVYAALGDVSRRDEAIRGLRALIRRLEPGDWVVKVYAMQWFSQLGSVEDSLQAGEMLRAQFGSEMVTNGWSWLWSVDMRPVRRDPRFAQFVAHLGMVDYWKKYGPPDGCELRDGKLACR